MKNTTRTQSEAYRSISRRRSNAPEAIAALEPANAQAEGEDDLKIERQACASASAPAQQQKQKQSMGQEHKDFSPVEVVVVNRKAASLSNRYLMVLKCIKPRSSIAASRSTQGGTLIRRSISNAKWRRNRRHKKSLHSEWLLHIVLEGVVWNNSIQGFRTHMKKKQMNYRRTHLRYAKRICFAEARAHSQTD